MRSLTRIPQIKDVPILLRTTLNVAVENGKVIDTFRIRKALPTIEYLRKKGARLILASHITGESHSTGVGTETLKPMWEALKEFIPDIAFCPVSVGPEARAMVRALKAGDVLLLENLRRNKGEMANDEAFGAELASLADVFVQDSFDNCHRLHASMIQVPKLLPSYAGLVVEEEVKQLTKALKPARPAVAIIAGAKFGTKEPVIVSLLSRYSHVFIGGALANDFIQAEGCSVGKSLTSGGDTREMRHLLKSPELLIPRDVVVAALDGTPATAKTVPIDSIPDDLAILDVGETTLEALAPYIAKAKSVLWNGTLGRYETGFTTASKKLAQMILASKARSVIGGGDTVTVLDELGLTKKFSFVSTGGGAMLDFLAHGTLPGLDALKK